MYSDDLSITVQRIGMSDQEPCENGNPNCDFNDKHEQLLVGEIAQMIQRYSKKQKISFCPSCLCDTMLSVAALLYLEAAQAETVKIGKPRSSKRLGDAFAKAARNHLETVRQVGILKATPGKHQRPIGFAGPLDLQQLR
jgi:hypothetical protein